jgi:hypothetical protein
LTALLLGAGAGLTLATLIHALDRNTVASVAVGLGVTTLLFVMLAFPEAATKRVWGRSRRAPTAITSRRVLTRVAIVGLCFAAAAIWLQSWLVALVAAGYIAFWGTLIYLTRDHRRT